MSPEAWPVMLEPKLGPLKYKGNTKYDGMMS